jgi:DNA-binding response OmpR family regulator
VVEAADGQTAGEVGERHGKAIDLLLTDVVLPQMSGRRVSENLLMYHPAIKVLYMSGYTDDYISHHGVLTAGTTLIEKPFSMDSLFLKIREVLDRKPNEPSIQ